MAPLSLCDRHRHRMDVKLVLRVTQVFRLLTTTNRPREKGC